nr:tombus P33-like protein [Tolivirales sp.]
MISFSGCGRWSLGAISAASTEYTQYGIMGLMIVVMMVVIWRVWPDDVGSMAVSSLDSFTGRGVTRLQQEVAYEFKAKFGELKYNKANQIIAGEFVRSYWREHNKDMRAHDIAMHYPMAVEMCLLPLQGAVEANKMARRRAVVDRRSAVQLPK